MSFIPCRVPAIHLLMFGVCLSGPLVPPKVALAESGVVIVDSLPSVDSDIAIDDFQVAPGDDEKVFVDDPEPVDEDAPQQFDVMNEDEDLPEE